jgi:tetratricopeptide (TPR) repeat protein
MNKRWLQLEDIAKGVSLALVGLLAFRNPDWSRTAAFFGITALGFVAALGLAGYRLSRTVGRVSHPSDKASGPFLAYFLFLILENPVLVYAGVLGGMLVASLLQILWNAWTPLDLLAALAAGVAVGVLFQAIRYVQNSWLRGTTVLLLGAGATAAILIGITSITSLLEGDAAVLFATHVLLAIPALYLLTFAGRTEESELEIGAMCVALGVALWIMLPDNRRLFAVLVPVLIYLLYIQYILRRLNVFKHVLRGMSFADVGMHRDALLAYRRALQLDPRNELAREGRWRVHKDIDFSQAVNDPETMALVDLDLCLERASELLLQPRPGPERLAEAHKLLNLVLDQRPVMQPAVYYWRAVAHTHAKEFDKAEAELRAVLDPSNYPPDDPYRRSVLVPCWQLALLQHGELRRRVGQPLLTTEGRRLDAIADVERELARTPDHAGAWELKRFLYEDLSESEYHIRRGVNRSLPAEQFDHPYCLQLGLTLLAGDPARPPLGRGGEGGWRRGVDFLHLSACGLPEKAPSIYYSIVQAAKQAGDLETAREHEEALKRLARDIGVKNLSDDDRKAYFLIVRSLGEAACNQGNIEAAIENLSMFVASPECGVDTLRLLAELHEKKGDALGALLWNEKALVLDGKDKQSLERKDRYYYSATPQQVQANLERAKKWLDVAYCVRKARSLLDLKTSGPEQVDWALHLAELARLVQTDSIVPAVLCARARLRRGEQAEALKLLEGVREACKERSLSGDEEEAWFLCARLLGDLYLQSLNRPDLALACYNDYRKYSKSGADTLFKIGQAYEALGDRVKAAKWYQNVTVYDHPLASDAYAALSRLQTTP